MCFLVVLTRFISAKKMNDLLIGPPKVVVTTDRSGCQGHSTHRFGGISVRKVLITSNTVNFDNVTYKYYF